MSIKMNPWHPITDPVALKHLGKLAEETGELSAVVARCIIQGIDEKAPITGKVNRDWLEDEIADVLANMKLVSDFFALDIDKILARADKKSEQLKTWHDMA